MWKGTLRPYKYLVLYQNLPLYLISINDSCQSSSLPWWLQNNYFLTSALHSALCLLLQARDLWFISLIIYLLSHSFINSFSSQWFIIHYWIWLFKSSNLPYFLSLFPAPNWGFIVKNSVHKFLGLVLSKVKKLCKEVYSDDAFIPKFIVFWLVLPMFLILMVRKYKYLSILISPSFLYKK